VNLIEPKLNIEALKDKWKQKYYIGKPFLKTSLPKGFLSSIFAMYSAIRLDDYSLIALHLMLFLLGFNTF
jgi:hypothetical protein